MAGSSLLVVGAGIAGLSAAHRARQRGLGVTVFEASARVGGVIETVRDGPWTADLGPNSAAERPALAALVEALGLEAQRVETRPEATARYVVQDGRPVALPASPPALARSPLLSRRAKARLLTEPFRRRSRLGDESVAAFVRRRLGPEVLASAVDPFLAGVFAGDAEQLSARHALPRLWALEADHGSVLRGVVRARRAGTPRPPSISFREGMQTLPDALAASLGDTVHLDERVEAVEASASGWRVTLATGERHDAANVILAVPAAQISRLVPGVEASPLDAVASPPVAVHALGFRRADVGHALDGLGVLVPSREPIPILGALFSSSMFPGRAPADHVLLTVFVGGTRQPDLALAAPDIREAQVLDALKALLGVSAAPVWSRTRLWPRAIPQYTVGYGRVLGALDAIEDAHPGLRFAGSYRGGIALSDAVVSGRAAVDALMS